MRSSASKRSGTGAGWGLKAAATGVRSGTSASESTCKGPSPPRQALAPPEKVSARLK